MALIPVLDFVKGRGVVATSLRVLVRDELLDLTGPVDNDSFETLDLVFLLGSSLNVMKVLIRDVQLSAANSLMAGLGEVAHESVEVGCELLLHTIRPFVLSEQLGAVLVDHLLQQVVQRISVNHALHNALVNVIHGDFFLASHLQIVHDLVVFRLKIAIIKFRRAIERPGQLTGSNFNPTEELCVVTVLKEFTELLELVSIERGR